MMKTNTVKIMITIKIMMTTTIMMMMATLTKYGYSSRKTSPHSPWTWPVAFPHHGDERNHEDVDDGKHDYDD